MKRKKKKRSKFGAFYTACNKFRATTITDALQRSDGNVTYAAVELGLRRTYLHRLIRELGVRS